MGECEQWLPVVGYEGLYEVSNTGKVRSAYKNNKELKQSKCWNYKTVQLWKDHVGKTHTVHRLIATAFIPNPEGLPQINHKDENKQNNDVSNLEWCTASYNQSYGTIIERRKQNTDYYSENRIAICRKNGYKRGKPVYQYTLNGEFVAKYDSTMDAKRKTGISASHIAECCKGQRYKSVGGFIWKYERRSDLLARQF